MKIRLFCSFILILIVFGLKAQISVDAGAEWNKVKLKVPGAEVLVAENKIVGFEVDTVNDLLFIKLQNEKRGKLQPKGIVCAFHLNENKILWQKEVDYRKDNFLLADTLPLLQKKNISFALNGFSGESLWQADAAVAMILQDRGLAIGQPQFPPNTLVGIDLKTGETKWLEKFPDIPNKETITISGDSALAAASQGMHYIDLETGVGFSHKAPTGYIGNTSAVTMAGIFGGLLGAALAQVIIKESGLPAKRLGNQISSFAIGEELIFFVSLKDIMAFNENGEIVWSHALPKSIRGLPKLFIHEDAVYILNYGRIRIQDTYAFDDIHFIKWNKKGELLAENILGIAKTEYINDFILRDSTILIALSNRMAEYSLDDLSLVRENAFGNPGMSSGLGNIISDPPFIKSDSSITNRAVDHPKKIYIDNSGGMKIEFSADLEIESVIRENNFYKVKQRFGNYSLLENGKEAVIIDSNGNIVNSVALTSKVRYISGRLYDFQNDKMLILLITDSINAGNSGIEEGSY